MLMSTRTKEIIQIVAAEKGFITIKEIAGKMGISERTVYREIPEVTDVFSQYGITLETVSKKGIRILGEPDKIKRLFSELDTTAHVQVVDPKERMAFIILALLHEEESIKSEALAIDMETSLPTIRNDLKKIGNMVPEYNLELVQKKGEGIRLSGSQVSKDHLLVNLLMKNIEIENLLRWLEGDLDKSHPFISRFLQYGYGDIFLECHELFQNLNERLEQRELHMGDRGYLEFVLLTGLLILRHRNGILEYDIDFHSKDIGKNEHKMAEYIIHKIKKEFHLVMEDVEVDYVLWLLHISISRSSKKDNFATNYVLKPKIEEFVQKVEERMGICLSQDEKLMNGLLTHMDKALERTRSGMSISNPIIREIEKDYKQLFSIIKDSVSEVFPEDYFPADEIGYLVLYFAVSLDNITKKTFRVLVVCSSGMGSSKMLASRLEREIPEIYVRKIVSLIGLGKEDLMEYDLILSTIPLYLDADAYLKVSPLLNAQELEMVKEKIRRHKHKTLRRIEEREKSAGRREKENGITALTHLNEFTGYSLQLLQDFTVRCLENVSEEHVFQAIFDWAREIGICLEWEELKNYYKSKHARECYFVIPTTGVSYFECLLECITKPALLICHFGGREVEDWQTSGEMIRAVTVLLYPRKMKGIQREFVESITDVLIEDTDIIRLIEKGDEEGIKGCLSHRFLEYIRETS